MDQRDKVTQHEGSLTWPVCGHCPLVANVGAGGLQVDFVSSHVHSVAASSHSLRLQTYGLAGY
jgi:hypothetical protein